MYQPVIFQMFKIMMDGLAQATSVNQGTGGRLTAFKALLSIPNWLSKTRPKTRAIAAVAVTFGRYTLARYSTLPRNFPESKITARIRAKANMMKICPSQRYAVFFRLRIKRLSLKTLW